MMNVAIQKLIGLELQGIGNIDSDGLRIFFDILPFPFGRAHLQCQNRLAEEQRKGSKAAVSLKPNFL